MTDESDDAAPLTIEPQDGPQYQFLASVADICIYGGTAFSGKTFGLLLEASRYIEVPGFGAVIFRRTSQMIRSVGGMWEESLKLYTGLDGIPTESTLEWTFATEAQDAKIKFSHMEHAKNRFDHKGDQIQLLMFDQLEDFDQEMFWYLVSRNRNPTTNGIRPYIRATVNPDPDSWVAQFISWWIDQDSGYPIPERSGALRWFVRDGVNLLWADDEATLKQSHPHLRPKSVTFIMALITDNAIGMAQDPDAITNLMALSTIERERLLKGNWKIRATAGKVFNASWFRRWRDLTPDEQETLTANVKKRVRYWDKAGTRYAELKEGKPFTAGVRMAKSIDMQGKAWYIIEHVERGQWTADYRERRILTAAHRDGVKCVIGYEQEPGSGGKESADNTTNLLAGFNAHADHVTGDKLTRALPFAAMTERGFVILMDGEWNDDYIREHHNYGEENKLAIDQVDASSGAFKMLNEGAAVGTVRWRT